jgi:hypothetical protein
LNLTEVSRCVNMTTTFNRQQAAEGRNSVASAVGSNDRVTVASPVASRTAASPRRPRSDA